MWRRLEYVQTDQMEKVSTQFISLPENLPEGYNDEMVQKYLLKNFTKEWEVTNKTMETINKESWFIVSLTHSNTIIINLDTYREIPRKVVFINCLVFIDYFRNKMIIKINSPAITIKENEIMRINKKL